jgi:bifunctional UDP-N-acetylglucosamine pyrophosphorylase/glucosamine-1-phosphate N-acetyltransferase
MKISFISTEYKRTMEPIICGRIISETPVAGTTLQLAMQKYFNQWQCCEIICRDDFWPSEQLLSIIFESRKNKLVKNNDNEIILKIIFNEKDSFSQIALDNDSLIITYPWDLLKINTLIISNKKNFIVNGIIREGVVIDGNVELGEGSVLLPGVYIEGNVLIGKNCKVGPNCYIRGNTSIGDNCHIGQAVEIKNSILMNNVSAGHLSYIGDSVIGEYTNFGAGTITANFRHDGKNHISAVDGVLTDTGLRKFGTVFGDNVHTGIHTSIFPGRKIWPDKATMPGDIVKKDIKPR